MAILCRHAATLPNMRFVHDLAADPAALQPARVLLEAWCLSQHVDPESMVIIANELCTNAIRHGQGSVVLTASGSPDRLGLGVRQEGRYELAIPVPDSSSDLQITGRGLLMVDALAESWGWQLTASSTFVWARLSRR